MWIMVVAFCFSVDTSIKCGSFVPHVLFPTEAVCKLSKMEAVNALDEATKKYAATLAWASMDCKNVGVGA